jgi:hypothetical protein
MKKDLLFLKSSVLFLPHQNLILPNTAWKKSADDIKNGRFCSYNRKKNEPARGIGPARSTVFYC